MPLNLQRVVVENPSFPHSLSVEMEVIAVRTPRRNAAGYGAVRSVVCMLCIVVCNNSLSLG
jgi:hypothetical protein